MKLAICVCVVAATAPVSAGQTEAERLIEAGHWKRARALVEARIREQPEDPLANFLLSQVRNAFGDRRSPLPLAEKAVALDGRTAKYHRQLAEVLGVTAQYSGMLRQLVLARRFKHEIETALALDPADLQALRDLMEFYLLAPGILGGSKEEARATAVRIAQADAAEGYLAQVRLALIDKEYGRLGEQYRKAVEAGPANYRVRIAAAEFYLSERSADLEAAERQARAALAIDKGRAAAYSILAEIEARRRHWPAMESTLAAARAEVPDDLTPQYRAADALLASGLQLPVAELLLRRYLEAEPEGDAPSLSMAHWKLGRVLAKMGRTGEAAAQWEQSLRLDRDSPAAADLKGVPGAPPAKLARAGPDRVSK